jgi:hypothetical protein
VANRQKSIEESVGKSDDKFLKSEFESESKEKTACEFIALALHPNAVSVPPTGLFSEPILNDLDLIWQGNI